MIERINGTIKNIYFKTGSLKSICLNIVFDLETGLYSWVDLSVGLQGDAVYEILGKLFRGFYPRGLGIVKQEINKIIGQKVQIDIDFETNKVTNIYSLVWGVNDVVINLENNNDISSSIEAEMRSSSDTKTGFYEAVIIGK